MSDKIRILQLGKADWSEGIEIPENVEFFYEPELDPGKRQAFDVVFLDRQLGKDEIPLLRQVMRAYTLFATDKVKLGGPTGEFYRCEKGQLFEQSHFADFLRTESRNFFAHSYGEKYSHKNLEISPSFRGGIEWDGNISVKLSGSFGDDFCQIASWRNNIPIFEGQAIDFWLEYKKDPTVEISLTITQFVRGYVSKVQNIWDFSEEDLQDIFTIDNPDPQGVIFVSLKAKGSGILEIIALHDRHSRRGKGVFIPGGERYVTSEREEVFAYFYPGDMKPPLNIYFSGYKTQEGFEGYYSMKKMGCPFLLISEPRLDGGCFYIGSDEYESLVASVIKKYMDELGFSGEHVIMSGLSMGTFGALYYGCDIRPHSLILGKPLASIGNIAMNEKWLRPGGFPTSLDALAKLYGRIDGEAVRAMNEKFWKKFERSDWSHSQFIVAYMIEDDYDPDAYESLVSHLDSVGVELYGKGLHGRHNDDTNGIVDWFFGQYYKVLAQDFSRKVKR